MGGSGRCLAFSLFVGCVVGGEIVVFGCYTCLALNKWVSFALDGICASRIAVTMYIGA